MKTLQDLQAPTTVQRKLLEADLQSQCVDWMRRRGYWARKFSSISQRSVPDYLFSRLTLIDQHDYPGAKLPHHEIKFACEFKKPGTKPKLIEKYGVTVMSTEAQWEEQEAMRKGGWYVFECDNFELFKGVVQAYERACAV